MHNVEARQKVRVIQIEIAVPAEADQSAVADEISALLSENGVGSENSCILDWRYRQEWAVETIDQPKEGEVFQLPRESTIKLDLP